MMTTCIKVNDVEFFNDNFSVVTMHERGGAIVGLPFAINPENVFYLEKHDHELIERERKTLWKMVRDILAFWQDDAMTDDELRDAFGTADWEVIFARDIQDVCKDYEAWKKRTAAKDELKDLRVQDVIAVTYEKVNYKPYFVVGMITKLNWRQDGSLSITYITSDGSWGLANKTMHTLSQIKKIGRINIAMDILGEIKTYENRYRDEAENK